MKLSDRINYLYLCAVIAGGLLVLSFPTFDLYPLAWVALAPLLAMLYDRSKTVAFKAGLLFGLTYFFGTVYWIYYSINHYGGVAFIPSLAIVLVLSVYLSLYPAVFCWLYSIIIKKADWPSLVVAPALWTSLEFIRSYAFTGFPWSSLGYSQYLFTYFIQSADIIGIYGISFMIVAVNGAIADLFILKKRSLARPLHTRLFTYAGWSILSLALVANFAYGYYRLHQHRPGSNIKAAVVQGNIEQDMKWDRAYQDHVIDIYRGLTLDATSHASGLQGPDLVVWPETAIPFYFGVDKARTEQLVNFERTLDTYLLFGSVLKKSDAKEEYSNSTVLLTKDGTLSYIYDKIHMVPFGEYVPLRGMLFFIDKLVVGIGDYVPGDSYIKAVTPFGSFSTPICYEIAFPGLVRKFYIKGGDFIVTVTNDAWFGRTNGPYQHFSMAVFRAIENRKPVIRAANTGVSGFINSNGEILSTTGLFSRTVLKANIGTDKTITFYTKYGDLFSFICIIISLLLIIRHLKSSRS
ncbi:MAG TPA: apolipoprotein N-acyltransferase [Dissulfurispiraceae bacterium]|nr:apolipoprotein N-acyltransferase [Dissulfurispiraceae bacterium]